MTTQTFPEALQLKVQRQLFNIVMEAKEEHMNHLRNSSERSSTNVHSFRGNSPFHVPIDNTSHSYSAMSNYSATDRLPNTSQSHIITETIPEIHQQNISEDASSMCNIRNYLEQSNFE
ncbi:unnamed protein product [Arctia plantaginis]|uniref:Uncharacterized protein n=1 Tax=Arctia plantaginis TaxID=874455 RepID=A0A8S1A4Z4_ARCPL|nr:unnamed protein product [Arctia plantaginis]